MVVPKAVNFVVEVRILVREPWGAWSESSVFPANMGS
jgi:hypothetical protein